MPTVTFKKYSVITSNTAILQKHGNLTEKKKNWHKRKHSVNLWVDYTCPWMMRQNLEGSWSSSLCSHHILFSIPSKYVLLSVSENIKHFFFNLTSLWLWFCGCYPIRSQTPPETTVLRYKTLVIRSHAPSQSSTLLLLEKKKKKKVLPRKSAGRVDPPEASWTTSQGFSSPSVQPVGLRR